MERKKCICIKSDFPCFLSVRLFVIIVPKISTFFSKFKIEILFQGWVLLFTIDCEWLSSIRGALHSNAILYLYYYISQIRKKPQFVEHFSREQKERRVCCWLPLRERVLKFPPLSVCRGSRDLLLAKKEKLLKFLAPQDPESGNCLSKLLHLYYTCSPFLFFCQFCWPGVHF